MSDKPKPSESDLCVPSEEDLREALRGCETVEDAVRAGLRLGLQLRDRPVKYGDEGEVPPVEDDGCKHASVIPAFDETEAKGLEAHQVRKRFPRFFGTCPECNENVIAYASFMHYISGDW